MTEILLHEPVTTSSDLERMHLFPGRALGEEEFDRLQAYADARMAPLLAALQPGILRGLDVNLGRLDVAAEGFTVSPGLALAGNGQALGLYYPVRQTWQTLIRDYLDETGAASAAGVFYLTLRRSTHRIDVDQAIDACQRAELDPTRDSRFVVLGTVGLRRLSISESAPVSSTRELIENWVAASHADGEFLRTMSHAVPLGLLAVEALGGGDYRVAWFSQTAGRYMAVSDSGYLVLLNQVNEALRRVLAAADGVVDETLTLEQYLNENLRLDFLPAAGQLPLELLQDPASATPRMLWLPEHLGIDMLPVPEESVAELIERHLPRRVVDLRQPAGDRLRLLLAINEPDYQPDLLNFPQTDARLQSDLFRYYMRARSAWHRWHRQFDHLYFLLEADNLDADELTALELPDPLDPPQRPDGEGGVFDEVILKAEAELTTPEAPATPYPYDQGEPTAPGFFTDWLVPDPDDPSGPDVPPPVETPTENGLVIRYALGRVELERIDDQVRAIRNRLEKTRDYLLLQRQQLDSQTVSLAALAGGVAGDGSGLQVARWLPYTELKVTPFQPPPTDAGTPTDSGGTTPTSGEGSADIAAEFIRGSSVGAFMAPSSFNIARTVAFEDTASLLAQRGASSESLLRFALPKQTSALEYGLNKSRLDRLSDVPKQALTRPAFGTKEYRFGVLDHIRPEIKEYKMAYRGMAELITTLDGLFDPADARALKAKLRSFGTLLSPEQLDELDSENATGDEDTDRLNAVQARYAELFKAGQILTKQIAVVEARYNRIEAYLERKLRERVNKEAELERLIALIKEARQELEALDKRRIEQLGDYGVAQRLLEDDWRRIHDENLKRTRLLTEEVRGLYYVRERAAPVSAALADPLELRFATAADIVPGCDWVEDPQLPEELETFFDAVLEVPMDDWAALQPLRVDLPAPPRIEFLYQLRRARFEKRRQAAATGSAGALVQVRLQRLMVQSQGIVQSWANARLPTARGSMKRYQQHTARVMSLEDLLSGTRGRLRREAQTLRDRLEQCLACLLEKLDELPPSIRLQWAQLAEDDRINVERAELWPGLERAEQADFNVTRTVAELIAWWFRQLDKEASNTGLSAMRNMIRGALIHAALGDPAEILSGQVQVPPRRVRIGEALRVKLNRAAVPGTPLQLLDRRQRVVATLNVDDHDEEGTTANIVRIERADVRIDTGFTVVASKRTKQLRY